MMNHMMKR